MSAGNDDRREDQEMAADPKIGAGHAAGMARAGLKELSQALPAFPDGIRPVEEPGIFGNWTQIEVVRDKTNDQVEDAVSILGQGKSGEQAAVHGASEKPAANDVKAEEKAPAAEPRGWPEDNLPVEEQSQVRGRGR